ncbi:40S ribosomal protein S2 [Myotis davidii]|uniref:40S ribosomal protein S2 n=1 Tax=Myotis davidii TaxID=225400 RepID=L5LTC4_MYODS|nr:40S ribosomal protein S2 [Myotis davidii]
MTQWLSIDLGTRSSWFDSQSGNMPGHGVDPQCGTRHSSKWNDRALAAETSHQAFYIAVLGIVTGSLITLIILIVYMADLFSRITSIISAPVPKKLLLMAGIDDCCPLARGCTATLGNFTKATFAAVSKTYSYLTPDF